MHEWVERSLRELIGSPISGSRPSGGVREDTDGVPSLGGENVLAEGGMTYRVLKRISRQFFALMGKGKLQKGDVLINKDGAQTGKVGFYAGEFEQAAVNEHLFILRSTDEAIDQRFLYYSLLRRGTQRAITRQITGSAQPGLSGSFADHVRLALPIDSLEQRRVAGVLLILDTAIQETEASIEKLKQVKQGILHDLLTRGIDANGELRPPQSQAPQLYKNSPLGWIPVAWEVKRLEELLSSDEPAMRSGPFGSALRKHELVESGVPLLGIDNVHVERFDANFTRFVTEKKFNELKRYAVRAHDLMITIMGTVGRCCIVPEGIGRALSSKHTWTITLDRAKYSPLLAMLQINYCEWIMRQFAKDEQGGIMSAIRSDTLRNLLVPVPHIEEQVEIESSMRAISIRIDAESAVSGKLRLERLGLMDDLLTGRVRVNPLLP
jgi:type I restriction enzyme S subunit